MCNPGAAQAMQGMMSAPAQSNGMPVMGAGVTPSASGDVGSTGINWGDPTNAADFFRADKALMAQQGTKTPKPASLGGSGSRGPSSGGKPPAPATPATPAAPAAPAPAPMNPEADMDGFGGGDVPAGPMPTFMNGPMGGNTPGGRVGLNWGGSASPTMPVMGMIGNVPPGAYVQPQALPLVAPGNPGPEQPWWGSLYPTSK